MDSFTLQGNMKDGSGSVSYVFDTIEEALGFAEQCRDYVITKFSCDETGVVVMSHVAYSESYAKAYGKITGSTFGASAVVESGLESFESIMERIMA